MNRLNVCVVWPWPRILEGQQEHNRWHHTGHAFGGSMALTSNARQPIRSPLKHAQIGVACVHRQFKFIQLSCSSVSSHPNRHRGPMQANVNRAAPSFFRFPFPFLVVNLTCKRWPTLVSPAWTRRKVFSRLWISDSSETIQWNSHKIRIENASYETTLDTRE